MGSFVLSNLKAGTGGRRPDIRVTFKLNDDGLLEVHTPLSLLLSTPLAPSENAARAVRRAVRGRKPPAFYVLSRAGTGERGRGRARR